jgi:hypothetical protein
MFFVSIASPDSSPARQKLIEPREGILLRTFVHFHLSCVIPRYLSNWLTSAREIRYCSRDAAADIAKLITRPAMCRVASRLLSPLVNSMTELISEGCNFAMQRSMQRDCAQPMRTRSSDLSASSALAERSRHASSVCVCACLTDASLTYRALIRYVDCAFIEETLRLKARRGLSASSSAILARRVSRRRTLVCKYFARPIRDDGRSLFRPSAARVLLQRLGCAFPKCFLDWN